MPANDPLLQPYQLKKLTLKNRPLEEDRFACFNYDFLLRKAKDLRSFGNEDKSVLGHEDVARLLLDALMVFAKAKSARLKETAIGRIGKVSRNAE